jgi:vacuolar-type H+-ATPase subunit I/STV1
MMGLFAMLGGFLFGSFFGAETVLEPLWPIFAHTINGEHNAYRTIHMLKLSIEIGAIQIAMGIFLSLYSKIKHREKREAIVSLSYLWLYLGFITLLFGVSYNDVNSWFSAEGTVNLWLPIVGIGAGTGNNGVYPLLPFTPLVFTLLAFVAPLAIMAITSFMGKMDGVVHFLESAIGMISHTVSYARIFALNTVHIILSGVFFTLPGIINIPMPPLTLFGVVIIPELVLHNGEMVAPFLPLLGAVIGSIIVGLLEGLLAFMHTLRLHMVEWYSKFYHAGGTEFAPFKIVRHHTAAAPLIAPAAALPTN